MHLLSQIPLLGEKRHEVEEDAASPRTQGHAGTAIVSDGGPLEPVCLLEPTKQLEASARPLPRGSDLISVRGGAGTGRKQLSG